MPFADSVGCRIYYRLEGFAAKPLLVLAHSLGTDHGMWEPQMAALLRYFQVLRLDLRGHGASDAPAGDYTMAQLAGDVLAAVDAVGRERFAYCGLSLGGMIGQWLGANAPARVERLVLSNTGVDDPGPYEVRRRTVLAQGMRAVEEPVASGNPVVESMRAVLLATDPVGYAGCCAAMRDWDEQPLPGGVTAPTLMIGGGHLSNIERPSGFTGALLEFLLPDAPADPLAAGFAMRRAVLGDAHVDRAVANTTELTRDFQELITRYAWGTIWTRPGLDLRVRRLLVLAMTASLGRWEEFRLHVRTGLAGELEEADLKEVLLQVAVYAGVPAANSGFQIANEESGRGGAGNVR